MLAKPSKWRSASVFEADKTWNKKKSYSKQSTWGMLNEAGQIVD